MNRGANKAIAETLMEMANLLESGKEHKSVRIGITLAGSELGAEELLRGIELANRLYPEIECIPIGRQIIDEKEDGVLELTFTATSEIETLSWVLSFGHEARVIEPDWFADQVREEVERMLSEY